MFQEEGLILQNVIEHIRSLVGFVNVVRDDFDNYERQAKKIVQEIQERPEININLNNLGQYRITNKRKRAQSHTNVQENEESFNACEIMFSEKKKI